MNIKAIFLDNSLVRKAVEESYSMRITEDINAVGGAIFELSIRNGFNAGNDDYKLYNFSVLENLVIPEYGEDRVDFGPFASTLSELKKKTKQSFGALSAADILLFKVDHTTEKSRLVLVDVASLKCSIPKDLSEKGPSRIALHNDPSGDIHDALSSGEIAGKNIGQIILIILRREDLRVYHFDGELSSLGSYFEIAETNEYGDLKMTSKDSLVLSSYGESPVLLETFNRKFEGTRRTKEGKAKKITSFMRGVKANISETKRRSPFALLESLSDHGVIEEITSIPFSGDNLRQRLCNQHNLIPRGF